MPELEQEAYVALLRAADALTHAPAAMLKEHGLTPAQYNVLRILRGAGAEGLRCGDVGARMIQREPDITRLLDRLERRGLTTRTRATDDRRVVHVTISSAGLEVLGRLDGPILEAHRAQFARLSPRRLEELVRTLKLLLPPEHL
ncbi:MAG: MarR family transcriptional regulator [Bryobacteraceae bacterium]|nr:MarR family transcriptional regulator [Bryobacteraceae bacterium]